MIWAKLVAVSVAALVLVWAGVSVLGKVVWPGRVAEWQRRMAAAEVPVAGRYDPAMLAGLPAPVARYLEAVLVPGQPMVARVSMAHEGTFDMGTEAAKWRDFSSTQQVTVARPGFVWDGKIGMALGMPVRVIDAYAGGEGALIAKIFGLVPVARLEGGGAIAEGELLRWLAEAPWYPTALLPGQGVEWTAIDDRSAEARVTDGAVTVSLVYRFGPDGLVEGVRAASRGRTVGSDIVPTPWVGRWWGYRRRGGMMVPTEGEVAWELPQGLRPYWRGRVTELRYGP